MLLPGAALAHPEVTDEPAHNDDLRHQFEGMDRDPAAALQEHDEEVNDVVDALPSGHGRRGIVRNLEVVGRGDRLVPDATTDVWVHDRYAYLGTFQVPCGTGEGYELGNEPVSLNDDVEAPGIAIFLVRNPNKPRYVGNLPSVEGSRTNDVKVFEAADGTDILVHSNEPCDGGPGGFEIYDVSDPENPVHLSRVTTGDVNPIVLDLFDTTDEGVHNLFLFSRDDRDYVGVQVEAVFDNFQIFDITDPTNAELVSTWGAEEIFDPGVGDETYDVDRVIDAYFWLIDGYGASQNRFLHDFWISEDGTLAYLANWDAGLVRLDLSDLSDPQVVSVALDIESEDGEVNSHSVWPSEDGNIVLEGEEDFAPFKVQLFINGDIFDAAEASFTPAIADLPEGTFNGDTVYVGFACSEGEDVPADVAAPVPAGGGDDIAVVQRGTCTFVEKVQNIENAGGYKAVIIFNDAARGDAVLTPGGDEARELPTVFVGYSTGLTLFGLTPDTADQLEIGMMGETASAEAVADGWSGFRIWDYSDPENPVLKSTYNTTCSADPTADTCDPRGTYSSHNVIVETRGNRVLAYISWYSAGVVVLDVTDPAHPVEYARYNPTTPEFEEQNGGIQDVWGIYKEKNRPFIYASDRNGGLYVLMLRGVDRERSNNGRGRP